MLQKPPAVVTENLRMQVAYAAAPLGLQAKAPAPPHPNLAIAQPRADPSWPPMARKPSTSPTPKPHSSSRKGPSPAEAAAPASEAARAPTPVPAAVVEGLDVQHAHLQIEGASRVLLVPSTSDIGVDVAVNTDDSSSEASSVQASLLPSDHHKTCCQLDPAELSEACHQLLPWIRIKGIPSSTVTYGVCILAWMGSRCLILQVIPEACLRRRQHCHHQGRLPRPSRPQASCHPCPAPGLRRGAQSHQLQLLLAPQHLIIPLHQCLWMYMPAHSCRLPSQQLCLIVPAGRPRRLQLTGLPQDQFVQKTGPLRQKGFQKRRLPTSMRLMRCQTLSMR